MLNLLCTHYPHEHNQKFYSIMTLKCETAPYLVMPRLILDSKLAMWIYPHIDVYVAYVLAHSYEPGMD